MTTYDYNMVMKSVRIAELKAKLSGYLREVRHGRSLTVMDRATPIARIVPVDSGGTPLRIRTPLPGALHPQDVPLPPRPRLKTDVVALLAEERQGEL